MKSIFFKRYIQFGGIKKFSNKKNTKEPISKNIKNTPALTFNDHKSAFKMLTFFEVVRGSIVHSLSSYPGFIQYSFPLMKIGQKVFGKYILEFAMKMTFYGQFVAGENLEDVKPLLKRLKSVGVNSILDYCVEHDIDTDDKDTTKEIKKEYDVSTRFTIRRARTAFYLNEAKCERNVEVFQKTIYALSEMKLERGILAVKMTSLGRPEMLLQLSEVIMQGREFATQILGIKSHKNVIEYNLTEEILLTRLSEMGIKDGISFMKNVVKDDHGVIHLFPWNGIINGDIELSECFRIPSLKEKRMVRLLSQFSSREEEMFKNLIRRLNIVISTAIANKVIVTIDAEQSYFQPAINRITMELMNIFNKSSICVMNTYQCYLKNSFEEIQSDLLISRRQNFAFASKLVRGAYMDQERFRANELKYKDPIHSTFEGTTNMLNQVIKKCLNEIKEIKTNNIFIMVASHNEDTINFAINEMLKLNIAPSDNVIGFGQLLGMKDYITFPLASKGYIVYKYVPYGPISDVIPYLARRVEENRGEIFKGTKDSDLYRKELKRRILRQ
uniref:Proline dehydrogenase n=1 Tax=Clastoptera arizonana TaxID=38151 RepID=A0A1B6DW19_9HEMI